MSITLSWALFNSYVPIFLRAFVPSSALVGFVMSLDNVAGMTLQPWFGGRSDRTRTRFGRRMPYLMIGMPLAALAIPLLPQAPTLVALILAIIAFDLAMSVFRAPTVALMPDLTPGPYRSQANGIINFMGGLGALIAFFVGAALYRQDPAYPFFGASGMLMFALILLILVIREPDRAHMSDDDVPADGILRAVRRLPREDLPLLWTLLALFGWSLGQSAVETFFTTYTVVSLGWNESTGAFLFGFFALAFLLSALPAGWVGARWGQHATLARGLIALAVIVGAAPLARSPVLIGAALALAGVAWGLVTVNAYPRIVQLGSEETIGTSTGLYYFFTSLAASTGPPAAGAVMDLMGEAWLFGFSAVSFVAAWFCLRQAARSAAAVKNAGASQAVV